MLIDFKMLLNKHKHNGMEANVKIYFCCLYIPKLNCFLLQPRRIVTFLIDGRTLCRAFFQVCLLIDTGFIVEPTATDFHTFVSNCDANLTDSAASLEDTQLTHYAVASHI